MHEEVHGSGTVCSDVLCRGDGTCIAYCCRLKLPREYGVP